MKNFSLAMLVASLAIPLGNGVALAQDEGAPLIIPVDIIPCTYLEGKGPADLDGAVDAWNAYVDGTANPDVYSAWTMTKHYAGPDQDFDFAWVGAWKDGNAMGAGWDDYYANAGAVQAGFDAVAQCDSASNYASVNHRPTPNNDTPSDGVLVFSDCSRKDGVSDASLAETMKTWSAVLDERGLEVGIFHWYPIFGAGGERTFEFKEVSAFQGHAAFGAFYEAMANGGLYQRSEQLLGPVMSCDVARVYNVKNRRFTQLRK